MKIKIFIIIVISIGILKVNESGAQSPAGYKLPDNFQFDYTVTQSVRHAKKIADSSIVRCYYTKSGDYAGASFSKNAEGKGNLFIIITRAGNIDVFDDKNKTITIISIRKLGSDIAGLARWIRMDSVIAHMRKGTNDKEFKSVKTGNHKTVGNYTEEEYTVTDSKGHKGSVWLTKTDFNTQGDYIMGAAGTNIIKMIGGNMTTHPLLQALIQPRTLVTEIELKDSAGTSKMEMQTQSIEPGE